MPKELYDLEGNKVETPTPEEIEEQKQKAVETARTEAEALFASEKEKIESEKQSLSEDLKKLQNKDLNFSKLRDKQTTEQQKEQGENQKRIDRIKDELEKKNQEIRNFVVGGIRSQLIEEISHGDPDVKEAMETNYSRIIGPENTKEEIETKVKEAYGMTLAQVGVNPIDKDITDTFSGGGGGKSVGASGVKLDISNEARQMGKEKFGITDKDFDKFITKK